jgi:phosphoglycolate phosphatase
MPPTKAILFDLDGTLLDTLADLADAMNAALSHFAYPQHSLESYKTAVGDGIHVLAERVLPAAHKTPETIATLVTEMQRIYTTCWMNKTTPYKGIPELLKELQARDIRTAVLSNKPDSKTRICVEHYFSPDSFDIVMGASDQFPLKPDPTAARHIMNTMQIRPENWLYLGDTNTDMQTASRAGIKAVGVSWGFRHRQELIDNGANLIIDTPLELLQHLI